MTLKELITRKCKACGRMTRQEDLARAIGCHPAALSHWINGRRQMTVKNADRIAKALSVKCIVVNGEFEFQKGK